MRLGRRPAAVPRGATSNAMADSPPYHRHRERTLARPAELGEGGVVTASSCSGACGPGIGGRRRCLLLLRPASGAVGLSRRQALAGLGIASPAAWPAAAGVGAGRAGRGLPGAPGRPRRHPHEPEAGRAAGHRLLSGAAPPASLLTDISNGQVPPGSSSSVRTSPARPRSPG